MWEARCDMAMRAGQVTAATIRNVWYSLRIWENCAGINTLGAGTLQACGKSVGLPRFLPIKTGGCSALDFVIKGCCRILLCYWGHMLIFHLWVVDNIPTLTAQTPPVEDVFVVIPGSGPLNLGHVLPELVICGMTFWISPGDDKAEKFVLQKKSFVSHQCIDKRVCP